MDYVNKVNQLQINARNAGKEGRGTHRNCGDSGRVAALWMEAKRELELMEASAHHSHQVTSAFGTTQEKQND
jgi:hypothetical protein